MDGTIVSYKDLRDFTPEYIVIVTDYMDVHKYTIQIEKLGGGTFGHKYSGTWRYIVWKNGQEIGKGQDFESGLQISHREAAVQIISFFTDEVTEHDFQEAKELPRS